MGNLSSCCLPGDRSDGASGERQGLLVNPVDGQTGDTYGSHYSYPGSHAINSNSVPGSGNAVGNGGAKFEQNALNRTLHKMAINVIDVATMDVASLEQSEWMDRQKVYGNRVGQIKTPLLLRSRQQRLTNQHQRRNQSAEERQHLEPISAEDIALINEFSERSSRAVKNGFVINVKEDLVVQFDP